MNWKAFLTLNNAQENILCLLILHINLHKSNYKDSKIIKIFLNICLRNEKKM